MKLRSVLTRSSLLWLAGVLALLSYLAIACVMLHWDMVHLDSRILPGESWSTLNDYTPGLREVHIWSTASLDVVFPLAYSALFAGLIWRGLPERFQWLVWFASATLLADLGEGLIQIILLNQDLTAITYSDSEPLLWLKAALTSLKFSGFVASAIAAIAAVTNMMRRRRGT